MSKKGEYVKCPKCGGQALVVWVSQDEKTAAIKCLGYHSHSQISLSPARFTSNIKTKTKKGMVFLIEATNRK